MKNINNILTRFIAIAMLATISSCSGFLDTYPDDRIPSSMVTSIRDNQNAVNGLYTYMKWSDYYGTTMILMGETRGDDLRPTTRTNGYSGIYNYDFTPTNNSYISLWIRCYWIMMNANKILSSWENIPAHTQAEINSKNIIKGEALAVRALCHFDIARMYGYSYRIKNAATLGAVKADRVINQGEQLPRMTVKETYEFVIQDLIEAISLLEVAKDKSKNESEGHFNYWAAKALLARVYLYMEDYDKAYEHANEVIQGNKYNLVSNKDYVASWKGRFDNETILELSVTTGSHLDDNGGANAYFALMWHLSGDSGKAELVPSDQWLALIKSDPNDVRNQLVRGIYDKNDNLSYEWLAKFPGWSGDPKLNNPRLIRLSEVYLIAAEAALKKSVIEQAKADEYLHKIRERANPAANQITATEENILIERRKELIGEGHRFFDLARLGKKIDRSAPDHTLTTKDYVIVDTDNTDFYRVVLPLSTSERLSNPKAEQNPNYPN